MTAVEGLLAAVARHGSAGAGTTISEAPLGPDEWDELLGAVRHQRLVGLLAAAVQDGALAVTGEQQDGLDEVERLAAIHVVQVEQLLLSLTAALESAGVASLVLKGPALAHTAYASPELRPFSDVDVLVRSADLDRALVALGTLDVVRKVPAIRPGFDRRFAKSVTCSGPGSLEVDLHRALAAGPLTTVLCDDAVFDVAATFELAGRTLGRLDVEGSFLHACSHLVLGGSEVLVNARDVVQLEAALGADLDVVVARADVWQLSAVVDAGLAATRRLLGLAPEWAAELSGRLAVTDAERAVLDSYPREAGREDVLALAALRHLPGVAEKARFAAAMAWPSAEHLRGRGLTRSAHLRRLARHLVPSRRR